MRTAISVLAALLVLSFQPAFSATAAQTAQQDKMKTCNAEAKTQSLSGDARKSFMKTCLSNQPQAAPKLNSQQQKMKQCNADAKAKNLIDANSQLDLPKLQEEIRKGAGAATLNVRDFALEMVRVPQQGVFAWKDNGGSRG